MLKFGVVQGALATLAAVPTTCAFTVPCGVVEVCADAAQDTPPSRGEQPIKGIHAFRFSIVCGEYLFGYSPHQKYTLNPCTAGHECSLLPECYTSSRRRKRHDLDTKRNLAPVDRHGGAGGPLGSLTERGMLNWSASVALGAWDGVSIGGSPKRVQSLRLRYAGLAETLPAALATSHT